MVLVENMNIETAKTKVQTLVISRLDNCNSLLCAYYANVVALTGSNERSDKASYPFYV